MKQNPSERIQFLTKTLLLSGGLNIVLIALLFYFIAKETPPRPYYELKPTDKSASSIALNLTNQEALFRLRALSFDQLIFKLNEKDLVDNGYSVRDLALATLVFFHNFNLNEALKGYEEPTATGKIPLGKNKEGEMVEVLVYQNLSDDQFKAVTEYATKEAFPVTNKGLFFLLRKEKEVKDPALRDTFYQTPEFSSVETLLNRGLQPIERNEILNLLLQGTWKYVSTFTQEQRVNQDLSPAKRQRLLLDYIDMGSQVAATILLKTDGPFASKKLDDPHVEAILKLLKEKNKENEEFAMAILTSPRGDIVKETAANKLYEFYGEEKPVENIKEEAIKRFSDQKTAKKASPKKKVVTFKEATPQSTPSTAGQSYVVQEGDSLWKISKKFKVSVDELKNYNGMDSDFLKPGTQLKIPKK